jgi:hypothetical protein
MIFRCLGHEVPSFRSGKYFAQPFVFVLVKGWRKLN